MTEVKEVIELLETAETKCLCTDDRLQPLAEIRKALTLLGKEPCGTCGGKKIVKCRCCGAYVCRLDNIRNDCPDCQEPAKPVDCKYSPHCKDFGNPFCNECCIGKEPAEDEQADDPPQEVKDRWRAEEQENCPEEAKVELPSEIVKGWTGLKPAEKPPTSKSYMVDSSLYHLATQEHKREFEELRKALDAAEAELKSQKEHIELLNQCDDSSTNVIGKMDDEIKQLEAKLKQQADALHLAINYIGENDSSAIAIQREIEQAFKD